MIAVDTGFLSTLVDRNDAWHERASAMAPTSSDGWVTTWPVLTEATHLMMLAEHLGHGHILSTDERDFATYRWKNRQPFKNLLAA